MRYAKLSAIIATLLAITSGGLQAVGKSAGVALLDGVIANSANHASAVVTSPIESASLELKLTAYNDDPLYRRMAHFDVDGIGGDIAYGIAPSISDGYLSPKSTKTWVIDLSKTYPIVVRASSSYSLAESRDEERLVNYRDILATPGPHRINCWVSVSGENGPKSTIGVELVASNAPKPAAKRSAPIAIIADHPSDPRIRLAIARLRSIADAPTYSTYSYAFGRKAAGRYIPAASLAGLGKDGFVIKPVRSGAKTTIAVSGLDDQGIAYGIIRLARTMLAYPGNADKLSMRMKPAFPIREMYEERPMCSRDELPRYKAQLDRYFEEGVNTADVWGAPLAPDRYYAAEGYLYKQPYGDAKTFAAAIDYGHSLGIKAYQVDISQMAAFFGVPLDQTRNVDKADIQSLYAVTQGGARDTTMLCLSDPVGVDIIRREFRAKCLLTKNLDGFIAYFADPGGCWCKDCRPWGKTIIRTLNDIYAPVIRSTNPKLKVILSLWGVDIKDIEYVANHLNELPPCMTAIQIPPTSMAYPKYMTYEPRIAPLIKKASKKLPVILQQFYDGVGFKDAWVDIWEHPMPLSVQENLRKTNAPHGTVKGVYGSAFRLGDQLVDLRLNMDWGWNPKKDPRTILTEFGDEYFGHGVGTLFADAMFAMETYWANEARRFHFDTSELSDADRRTIQTSLAKVKTAEDSLLRAEKSVTRSKLYYKGFVEEAELMRVAAEGTILADSAWKLSEQGKRDDASGAISKAITLSERAIDIIAGSDRYSWLMGHPWWRTWSIGSRPASLRNTADVISGTRAWGLMPLKDGSFEERTWKSGGRGRFSYASDAKAGLISAELAVAPDQDYVVINQPAAIRVLPNSRYRATFYAKVLSGTPSMYLDLSSPGDSKSQYDGPNSNVEIKQGKGWQKYTVSVRTPDMASAEPLELRFVAVGQQELLVDDVNVYGMLPE